MAGQASFFDLDERCAALSANSHLLDRPSRVVDFEIFPSHLKRALGPSDRRKGGRSAMDAVLMFKILKHDALSFVGSLS